MGKTTEKTNKKTNKEIPGKVFTDMETIRYSFFTKNGTVIFFLSSPCPLGVMKVVE